MSGHQSEILFAIATKASTTVFNSNSKIIIALSAFYYHVKSKQFIFLESKVFIFKSKPYFRKKVIELQEWCKRMCRIMPHSTLCTAIYDSTESGQWLDQLLIRFIGSRQLFSFRAYDYTSYAVAASLSSCYSKPSNFMSMKATTYHTHNIYTALTKYTE